MRAAAAALFLSCVAVSQAPRTFSGVVVDERGAALQGVAVCPFDTGKPWTTKDLVRAATVRTGADGTFRLEVSDPDLDEALFVGRGRVHVMERLERLTHWPVQLAKGRALAGQVRGTDGEPIAGARVFVRDAVESRPFLFASTYAFHHPRLWTAVRTGANGRFVVPGVYATGLDIEVRLAGRQSARVRFASTLDPLTIAMAPCETVSGIVRRPDGSPAGAGVRVYGRAGDRPEQRGVAYTDEAGRFAYNWLGAEHETDAYLAAEGRVFRASAAATKPGEIELRLRDYGPSTRGRSRSRSRPRVGPALRKEPLVVTAVGPDGARLDAFDVGVFQVLPRRQLFSSDIWQLDRFAQVRTSAEGGVAKAKVYDGRGKGGLLAFATAPGMAMVRADVAEDAREVELRFEAAQPIAGTAVDARTGKGVAGARLWFLVDVDGEAHHNRRVPDPEGEELGVRAGEGGAFRIVDAIRGDGRVFCAAPGYASGWVVARLGDRGEPLRVVLEPLVDMPVQVGDGPLAPPVVGLAPRRDRRPDIPLKGFVPLSRTGAASLPNVSVGGYELDLVYQRLPRTGRPDLVPLERREITHETKALTFDGDWRPGRVRGRVTGSVPFSRLAVLCAPVSQQRGGIAFISYEGPFCPLELDGSYELQAPPGPHTLCVIDFVTGVMFARQDDVEIVPGVAQVHDFEVRGHEVRVQIDAPDQDRAAGDWFVEVLPPTELWPGRVGQILPEEMAFNLYSRGMGIRLAGGATSGAMWLPAEPFQVTLRRYREGNSARANGEHRGDTTIEGDQKEVTLKW